MYSSIHNPDVSFSKCIAAFHEEAVSFARKIFIYIDAGTFQKFPVGNNTLTHSHIRQFYNNRPLGTALLTNSMTNADVLLFYVKSYMVGYFPEVLVEEMKSSYPDRYKSFKIEIDSTHFEEAIGPEKWPSGAYVTRFHHPLRKWTQDEQKKTRKNTESVNFQNETNPMMGTP